MIDSARGRAAGHGSATLTSSSPLRRNRARCHLEQCIREWEEKNAGAGVRIMKRKVAMKHRTAVTCMN